MRKEQKMPFGRSKIEPYGLALKDQLRKKHSKRLLEEKMKELRELRLKDDGKEC